MSKHKLKNLNHISLVGVAVVGNKMIDRPVVEKAERVLMIARLVESEKMASLGGLVAAAGGQAQGQDYRQRQHE